MKAVVTGGAGFIGSHLVEELLAEQFEVHIIDNLISGKQKHVNPQAIFHLADISSEQIKPLIVDIRPDVVFHLAAQADVQRSIQNPGYDAMVNLVGTIYCLRHAVTQLLANLSSPPLPLYTETCRKSKSSKQTRPPLFPTTAFRNIPPNPTSVCSSNYTDCPTPFFVMEMYTAPDKRPKEKAALLPSLWNAFKKVRR